MKFALILLVLLPVALSTATNEKRILFDELLTGVNITGLAQQVFAQFGATDTDARCENKDCPSVIHSFNNTIRFHALTCAAVCKEVQVLAN